MSRKKPNAQLTARTLRVALCVHADLAAPADLVRLAERLSRMDLGGGWVGEQRLMIKLLVFTQHKELRPDGIVAALATACRHAWFVQLYHPAFGHQGLGSGSCQAVLAAQHCIDRKDEALILCEDHWAGDVAATAAELGGGTPVVAGDGFLGLRVQPLTRRVKRKVGDDEVDADVLDAEALLHLTLDYWGDA